MEIFESISWRQYLTVVGLVLVIYYAVILLRHNRKNMGRLVKIREVPETEDQNFPDDEEGDDPEPETAPVNNNIHTWDELETLVTEIGNSILEKAGKEISKAELLRQLQQRLNNYGGLRQPAFRLALNNFLIEQSENICGVTFSEEELNEAWAKLPR